MGDVDERRAVWLGQQRRLHLGHVAVGCPEIGEPRDDVAGHQSGRWRHAPLSQKRIMAPPRATAVSEIAHQIPASPKAADHQAARGMRRAESDELATIGQKVYPAPPSAPSRMISKVCPTWDRAMIRKYRLPSAITAGSDVNSPARVAGNATNMAAVETVATRQYVMVSRTASRARCSWCAPRFWPTSALAESANPEIAMKPIPSTLCPTPSAASAGVPKRDVNRVSHM